MERNISNIHKLGMRSLPSNFGPLKGANANARIHGPCGDTMEMWLGMGNDKVIQATFVTDGCLSSVVAGCLTAWLAEGRSLDEARQLSPSDVLEAAGEGAEEHCALLAVNTLKTALDHYERQKTVAAPSRCPHGSSEHQPQPPSSPAAAPAKPPADPHDEPVLKARLQSIRHKVIVLSGKGGVGKSTVAANLAVSLAMSGCRVGLLDVDIHGPSIPKLMGLEGQRPTLDGETIQPIPVSPNLKVMSIGFLLAGNRDAVIWRGPMKFGVIQQFLRDVAWGDLDFLIVDSPPGTGDEPLAVAQLIGPPASAVIVTTPQDVAVTDVRRSVTFCQRLSLHVLGIVENMSGFLCPRCGHTTDLFGRGGGEALAHEMKVPFLGRLSLDPKLVVSGDTGTPFVHHYAESPAALAFAEITRPILAMVGPSDPRRQENCGSTAAR